MIVHLNNGIGALFVESFEGDCECVECVGDKLEGILRGLPNICFFNC